MTKQIYFYILFGVVSSCYSLEILIAVPNTPKSLSNIFVTLGKGLVLKGHNITIITPFPPDHKSTGIISIPMQYEPSEFEDKILEIKSIWNSISFVFDRGINITNSVWSDPKMMELWERRKDFDMIISMSYLNEMVFPFLMDNPAIFVQVCTPGVEYHAITRAGNWLMPSVVPSILLDLDDYMSFWERVVNLPLTTLFYNLELYLQRKFQKDHLSKYFPEMEDIVSYYDRVALTLINGHFSLDGPVPLLPTQVEIGTINIKEPKPLDKELAEFVEGSGEAGVVYFSLGSMAKSAEIPREIKDMFIEAFHKIPQRVVWKYEGSDLTLPPNVMTRKWMPQQDILGHPKTKVFISHCGNLGTQEAKYFGVPVLGLPIAFDQPRNAARMVRKGYAIVFRWEDITTDDIVTSLDTLINGTSYIERLQAVSRVLKDQKESPIERAIWWLEYVARHQGAPHLRYAGKRLSFFQYVMLDVILFLSVVVISSIFILFYCCRFLLRGKKNKTTVNQPTTKQKLQ